MSFILSLFCFFFLSIPARANTSPLDQLLGAMLFVAILLSQIHWLAFSFALALIFTIFKRRDDKFEKRWVALAIPLWILQVFSHPFLSDYSYKVKYELGYAATDDSTSLVFVIGFSLLLTLSLILFFRLKKTAGGCLLLLILALGLAYPQIVEWSAKKEAFHQMSQNPILQVPGVSAPYRQGVTVPGLNGSGTLSLSAEGLSEQVISFPKEPGAVPLNPGNYKICLSYEEKSECYLVSLKPGLLVRFNERRYFTSGLLMSETVFRCLPQEACKNF